MTNDIFASPAAKDHSHIVQFRTEGNGSPLFCFPGSGGNVYIFRELIGALPEGQPVYAIDMEWLCDTTQEFSVEQLAAFCLDQIRKIQKFGPYYFCGFSFGGLVAFEIALRLIDEGDSARLVALLDAPNPALISNLSEADFAHFRKTYLIDRTQEIRPSVGAGRYQGLCEQGTCLCHLSVRSVVNARNQDSISDDEQTIAGNSAFQRPGLLESVEFICSKALSEECCVFSG